MSINFKLNRLLFTSGQHVKITHPPKIMVDRCKNTKSADNASQLTTRLMSNDNDINVKLYSKAIIKANGRLLKIITVANKYIEIFIFGEDCLLVQIKTIKNGNIKITVRSIAYAKLVTKFLENGLLGESK